ncbi:MAG: tripartite tricarboxylate transporter substrate binding protein [Burkholderia sp.]|jgi:tripartite-type tricarboxylate transporter receptor subunit TctC|nr:tripartite tricarboxylate transporter substrate binding protein [Burkholderia sp.]
MNATKRLTIRYFAAALAATSASLLAPLALAQDTSSPLPEKTVRLVVPYSAGGGTDIIARHVAERLRARLHRTIVVENKPGANGVIGTDMVAKSAPDGTTIVLVVNTHLLNPLLMKKLPYDTFKDLTPITKVATSPLVVVVSSELPVKNVRELTELMRKDPQKYSYGSSENMTRLVGAMYVKSQGVDPVHVPYKGGAPLMTDVVSGVTTIGVTSVLTAKQFITSGRLRALAVTGAKRTDALPDVPTMMEAGSKDFEAYTDYTLFAPAGTPRPVLEYLQKEITSAIHTPEMVAILAAQAAVPVGAPVAETTQQVGKDFQFWQHLVADVGLKAE